MRCAGLTPRIALVLHTASGTSSMAPTTYFLKGHVHMCVAGHHCVLLDVKSNRYLSVEREQMDQLRGRLFGWRHDHADSEMEAHSPASAAALIQELLHEGLLTTRSEDSHAAQPPSLPTPTRTLYASAATTRARALMCLVPFLLSCAYADYSLRRRPFEAIIDTVRGTRTRRRPVPSKKNHARLGPLITDFATVRLLYPRRYLCLFDTLALLTFLTFYGLYPTWVFGVQSEPFMAHCWLQFEEEVIYDTIDNVRLFTPIMTVRSG
jgi:hypothetical protein